MLLFSGWRGVCGSVHGKGGNVSVSKRERKGEGQGKVREEGGVEKSLGRPTRLQPANFFEIATRNVFGRLPSRNVMVDLSRFP